MGEVPADWLAQALRDARLEVMSWPPARREALRREVARNHCHTCDGRGGYRAPDPAGRGDWVVCEVCGPKPDPVEERIKEVAQVIYDAQRLARRFGGDFTINPEKVRAYVLGVKHG